VKKMSNGEHEIRTPKGLRIGNRSVVDGKNMLQICGSIGMILAGLGGFAAFLALLDGSYAQAAASALVALLLCPFAAPMLLSLAGSALIVTAAALFAWLF
jgi:hypothetical protein